MAAFLIRNLNQTITLWSRSGVTSSGDPSFSSPTQIDGRWEWNEGTYINERGEESKSRAVVYLDQDVSPGDFLYLGTSASSTPRSIAEAAEVVSFLKTPRLRVSTEFERKAILA